MRQLRLARPQRESQAAAVGADGDLATAGDELRRLQDDSVCTGSDADVGRRVAAVMAIDADRRAGGLAGDAQNNGVG
jgi:hypothetical protein